MSNTDGDSKTMNVGGVAGSQLRAYIERAEHIQEEIKALQEDQKEIFAEAKGNGFDVKIIKQILRIRKMDRDELDEQEALLDLYMQAIGMRFPERTEE